ncbi:MAG: dihydroneopterin aldolase [Brevundimonas sp.]|uniref:dihydroneopterin aldolase n=1 Tax=Brevundimonas sp. TaxID=1871086 RepID=UPI002733C777|nr:dihydroneopterin aldolase [Brevundimonas sp.]MDP3406224.1 dihydroneopterin aldolase [Brevundimonas sp.]
MRYQGARVHHPAITDNMTRNCTIELRDLELAVRIGTYGPGDVVPDCHLLDLTLTVARRLVLIDQDEMTLVLDYDPLIARIDQIARAAHYATQERVVTLIAKACAAHAEIEALDIYLRKHPVLAGTGTLGVRLGLDRDELTALRKADASSVIG